MHKPGHLLALAGLLTFSLAGLLLFLLREEYSAKPDILTVERGQPARKATAQASHSPELQPIPQEHSDFLELTNAYEPEPDTVSGVVLSDGVAAADVMVALKFTRNATVTDYDGFFSLPATGHQILIADGIEYPVEAGQAVVVTLPRKQVIVGRVVDALGKPVAQFRAGTTRMVEFSDGRFRINHVGHDTRLLVSADNMSTASVVLRNDQLTVDAGTIVLQAAAKVRGTVVDAGGKPIAGASLATHPVGTSPLPQTTSTATTSADGAFEITVTEPVMHLSARYNGRSVITRVMPGDHNVVLQVR